MEIDNTRKVKWIERVSHYSLTFSNTCGCDNNIGDMLSRNPDDTTEAPDNERNFNTVRRIRRVRTRSAARVNKENVPRDL